MTMSCNSPGELSYMSLAQQKNIIQDAQCASHVELKGETARQNLAL